MFISKKRADKLKKATGIIRWLFVEMVFLPPLSGVLGFS
jgi:hypothetical protein